MALTDEGRKALERVADWLEDGAPHTDVGYGSHGFDMAYGVETDPHGTGICGTVCCIAGAVCQFEKLGGERNAHYFSYFDSDRAGAGTVAREFLGLTEAQANRLFMPYNHYHCVSEDLGPAHAARVVRRFLETGEVHWDLPPPRPHDED